MFLEKMDVVCAHDVVLSSKIDDKCLMGLRKSRHCGQNGLSGAVSNFNNEFVVTWNLVDDENRISSLMTIIGMRVFSRQKSLRQRIGAKTVLELLLE